MRWIVERSARDTRSEGSDSASDKKRARRDSGTMRSTSAVPPPCTGSSSPARESVIGELLFGCMGSPQPSPDRMLAFAAREQDPISAAVEAAHEHAVALR